MNTKQTQLRIESSVKDRFQEACRSRNSTMTSEIVRFMKYFIEQQYQDEQVIRELGLLDTQMRTGLVSDSHGNWCKREEYDLHRLFDDF